MRPGSARLIGLVLAVATPAVLGLASSANALAAGPIITDYAGTGAAAAPTAGPATSSALHGPAGVAVDAQGNVYVADSNNNVVEKVTPDGTLSIIAGNGTYGSPTSGPATTSALKSPQAVTVDAAGDVFIADESNKIEKVTPAGTLSIIAGTGTAGAPTPGPATSSRLNQPDAVAVDAAGDVYIADWGNYLVEKVTPGGTLSIIAGDGSWGSPTAGPARSSMLPTPWELAVDSSGDVYIADEGAPWIEKVTPAGTLSIVAGTGSGASPTYGSAASSSPVDYAEGVAVSADDTVFLADSGNNTIDRIGFATPGAPGQPALSPGDGIAQLSFTEPIDLGTSALTSYQVSLDGGATWQTVAVSPGAGSTLTGTLTGLTDGTAYTVLVRAVNGSGAGAASPSASVTPEAVPVDTAAPSISGSATVGGTETAVPGTWTGGSITYGYQWLLNGAPISGATAATFVLIAADAGNSLSVRVTATNATGQQTTTSAAVTVANLTPTPTSPTPTPPPIPTPAPTPVLVTVGAVPSAGIAVTDRGQAMLTLVCPATPTGCDASGELVIHLPKTLLDRAASLFDVDAASADGTTVLASFSGEQIAGGHSAQVAVKLNTSVLRRLQTLRIRRVKVTLTVSNHLNGGPTVTSTDTIYLQIPPLASGACPVATGQLTATTLGRVTLGGTRARARRLMPGYTARNYHTDNFCLYDASGIRVGYASPKLLGAAASAAHPATTGTVILALTANHYYTIDGIRPGSTLATAARHLHLSPLVHAGRNDWYVIQGATSNIVLKVRHGIVQEIGIATKRLTSTRARQLQLLSNF